MGHAERDHAILSPSSAKRWIHCTPSALLAEAAGSKTSVYAEEGTLAHEISEYALTKYLNGEYDPIIDDAVPLKANHLVNPLFGVDMADYIRDYCDYVIGENYEMQKENVEVAKRVYKSISNKHKHGLVSSLDLTQANSNYLRLIFLLPVQLIYYMHLIFLDQHQPL